MEQRRQNSFILLAIGCIVFVGLGWSLQRALPDSMADFKGVYYSTRCLLEGCDPYRQYALQQVYFAEGPESAAIKARMNQVVSRAVYPPTTFPFFVPLAMLPVGAAAALWTAAIATAFILASMLVWDLSSGMKPGIGSALVSVFLICQSWLLTLGNPAGMVVSLCVIGVWCFLRMRFAAAGVLCLAVGLAIKPHDVGLVWLYFLLAAGESRKRAWQALGLTVLLSVPGVLWVNHVVPNWMHELSASQTAAAAHGGPSDVAAAGAYSPTVHATIVNLQTVVAVFRDDPRIDNAVSYLICAPLLLIWALVVMRGRFSLTSALPALAAISALSMLPVYHRQHDMSLLVLTLPACAVLWNQRSSARWTALLLTLAGAAAASNLAMRFLALATAPMRASTTGMTGKLLTVVFARPAPLVLLAIAIFYLYVSARQFERERAGTMTQVAPAPASV
jgi:Glycosyltransferase family 87